MRSPGRPSLERLNISSGRIKAASSGNGLKEEIEDRSDGTKEGLLSFRVMPGLYQGDTWVILMLYLGDTLAGIL
jgi:hypothetical protein